MRKIENHKHTFWLLFSIFAFLGTLIFYFNATGLWHVTTYGFRGLYYAFAPYLALLSLVMGIIYFNTSHLSRKIFTATVIISVFAIILHVYLLLGTFGLLPIYNCYSFPLVNSDIVMRNCDWSVEGIHGDF